MIKISLRLIAAIPLALLIWLSSPDKSSAQAGLVISVQAGLDGYCKAGTWTPIAVTIENNGGNLEGQLYIKAVENLTEWFFNTNVSIPSVSRKAYTLYAYPPAGRLSDIEVGLIADGKPVHVQEISLNCLSETDFLMGVWAENPSLFNPQTSINTGSSRAVLLVLDETVLPTRPEGLEMLTSLTISNVDAGKLTDSQRDAISTWITRGGKLIIAGGPNWLATTSGFEDILPFEPDGTQTVDQLDALLNLAPSGASLAGPVVITTGSLKEDAVVTAGDAARPLITSRQRGFGTVIFLSADPTLEPLRTWAGINSMYDSLLSPIVDAPPWNRGFQDWMSATNALNTIEGLGMPPFLLVCGFILLYVLTIGPINFIVLRRRQKRETAWISVPILAVSFTALILLVSFSFLGNRPVLNRLSVVQAWPGADRAMVHGLVGVFSPQRETFSIEMNGDFIASPVPQSGFGSDGWNHQIFQEENGFRVPDIRVDLGGLQGIVVSGQIPAPAFDASFRMEISDNGAPRLAGTFTNRTEMTFRDVVLLSGALPSTLGDISPGETVSSAGSFAGSRASSAGSIQNFGPLTFGSDNTLNDLFGMNYMYPSNTVSVETYRRFNLMSAALGGPYNTRGGGVYIVGWTDAAPFETNVSGGTQQTADTTVYIFQIQPEIDYDTSSSAILTLPPGMFSWKIFEPPAGDASPTPYEAYLGNGNFSLQFSPKTPVRYTDVDELTLHLESYGAAGPSNLSVYLWDFRAGSWSGQPTANWGDTKVSAPQRFVGPDGEIRLKVENASQFSVSIEKADFTLTLRH